MPPMFLNEEKMLYKPAFRSDLNNQRNVSCKEVTKITPSPIKLRLKSRGDIKDLIEKRTISDAIITTITVTRDKLMILP